LRLKEVYLAGDKWTRTNRKTLPHIGALALVVGLIFYINTQILLYADDFFYGTFFRDGFAGFFEMNVWHYMNFNGRVFVHILVQITLVFGTYLFPFVNLAFLIFICFFAQKIQKKHENNSNLIQFTAFFLATVMLLDVSILRESYLWISASFNYTFGVLMTVILLFICKRYAETQKLKWYMPLLAFLAGATTEQMGLTAVVAVSVWSFVYINNKEITLKKSLFLFIPCVIGLVTIFLSPATMERMGAESLAASTEVAGFHIGEFFMNLFERFDTMSQAVYEANFAVVFAIFGMLAATLTCFDKSISSKLKLGFIYSAIVLALQFMPFIPVAAVIFASLSVIFFVFTAILLLKHKDYAFSAILIFAAFFSLFVILFTDSNDPRTAFPAILLIIAVCANFTTRIKLEPLRVIIASEKLKMKLRFKQVFVLPIYVVICCIVFIPVIVGYHQNKQIMNENVANISLALETGGDIFYNIDFRDSHRHALAQDDGFFYHVFRLYYEIDENTNIFFVSEKYPPVYTLGRVKLTMPARYINGEVLFPISQAVIALGGESVWDWRYTRFRFDDYEFFTLDNQTATINFYRNGNVYEIDLSDRYFRNGHIYLFADDIEEIFGITYAYRDGRYIIQRRRDIP